MYVCMYVCKHSLHILLTLVNIIQAHTYTRGKKRRMAYHYHSPHSRSKHRLQIHPHHTSTYIHTKKKGLGGGLSLTSILGHSRSKHRLQILLTIVYRRRPHQHIRAILGAFLDAIHGRIFRIIVTARRAYLRQFRRK